MYLSCSPRIYINTATRGVSKGICEIPYQVSYPYTISIETVCHGCLFGGDSSHITILAKMTFKHIFICKPLIDYVLFLFTKQEKYHLMHRFLKIWNLSLFESRRTPTSIYVVGEVLQLSEGQLEEEAQNNNTCSRCHRQHWQRSRS